MLGFGFPAAEERGCSFGFVVAVVDCRIHQLDNVAVLGAWYSLVTFEMADCLEIRQCDSEIEAGKG